MPSEILVDAVRAVLPDSILRQLEAGRAARSARGASGSGAEKAGNRQGRPLPSRKGKPQGDARLDLVATLRAAAPWQPLRRAEAPHRAGQMLLVDPTDLHIRRSKQLSDRLLIFAVDASGSAAVARLAEAKGAVELLLAQAYSRRDHVALLTFRGQGAALILPPSRSLVATKQKLRGLPGGGGTPLAQGLQLALTTARQARGRGLTPTIALSDRRARQYRAGRHGRPGAGRGPGDAAGAGDPRGGRAGGGDRRQHPAQPPADDAGTGDGRALCRAAAGHGQPSGRRAGGRAGDLSDGAARSFCKLAVPVCRAAPARGGA
jgi:magnesium chelatase subunit D